jgi:hypothetical protein
VTVLAEVALRAGDASPLWREALLDAPPPDSDFAGRCPDDYLLGVEMIREGYLLHRGRSRLFRQDDAELALLTGDHLYAAGLVEICRTRDLQAVASLAELIAACAGAQAEPGTDDDQLWSQTVAGLGRGR